MAKYRRYENYSDSGITWLGEIPAHWKIKKLKYVATVYPSNVDKKMNKDQQPVKLCNYTDVYYNELIVPSLNFMQASATRDQISKFSLRAGDTILTKDSEDPEDIAIPAYVPETLSGVVCGYHLALIRPNTLDLGAYLKRLFESRYARSIFAIQANGLTRYGLGTYPLNNIRLPSPPVAEAKAIAAFLDHETAKIDRLIARQERLIELLKEKRQAVISHAVTKGINTDAPMKDSGVEWLGEVPAHWMASRIKFVTRGIIDGPHFSPSYVDEGVLFISARNVKEDRWSFDDAKYVTQEDYNEFCKRVKPVKGDVLLTKGGTTGVARAVDFDEPFQVWVHIAVLKTLHAKADPFFLAYALNGKPCYEQSQLYTRGATNNDLGLSRIANIYLGLPGLDEQKKITEWLNKITGKIDTLIEKARVQIALLLEHRTALVSAAVTGKIDVRGWQKPDTEPQDTATAVSA